MGKYIRVFKANLSHVLVLTLCLFFSVFCSANSDNKFDMSKAKLVDTQERMRLYKEKKVYSTVEAFEKLYPGCVTFKTCEDKYRLLNIELYKSDKNVYFYSVKVLDQSKKGKRSRVIMRQIKAEKELVQKAVEEDYVEQ